MISLFTHAQTPQLSTEINKQHIIIGEPFKIKVQATFPANAYRANWFNIPDSIAHFEVIERSKIDTVAGNGMIRLLQIITLTSFDSGQRKIPSFPLNFSAANNYQPLRLFTDSISVNVSFSPMDSVKTFHDIKPIIAVKDEFDWKIWIAAALSLLLLIVLIYLFVKNLRKKKPQKLFDSKLSPLDEAMQSLNDLQKQQLLIRQEVKPFHSSLTDIFKRYISRKTNSNISNLTSEEVLLKLNEMQISKEIIALAASNLRMADAVKFAKYLPSNIQSEEALSNTKNVIQHTDQFIKPASDI